MEGVFHLEQIVIIICGYSGSNMKEYIKEAARYIRKQSKPCVTIVSGKDEAEFIKNSLLKRSVRGCQIIVENKSIDKKENIENCSKIINNFQFDIPHIYIFCDSMQISQINFDSKHYLNNFHYEIIGYDFHRNIICKFFQLFVTLKDYMLLKNISFVENIYLYIIKHIKKNKLKI